MTSDFVTDRNNLDTHAKSLKGSSSKILEHFDRVGHLKVAPGVVQEGCIIHSGKSSILAGAISLLKPHSLVRQGVKSLSSSFAALQDE